MLWPFTATAPPPAPDMPRDVQDDYLEAMQILGASPRGAAALLRLALEKLMPALGERTKKLDTAIGSLVKRGLPTQIQQALDSVRVIGNEAVHPGVLDLRDDSETAGMLFELLNLIVETMITQPKKVQEIFQRLPQPQLDAIARRDGTASGGPA